MPFSVSRYWSRVRIASRYGSRRRMPTSTSTVSRSDRIERDSPSSAWKSSNRRVPMNACRNTISVHRSPRNDSGRAIEHGSWIRSAARTYRHSLSFEIVEFEIKTQVSTVGCRAQPSAPGPVGEGEVQGEDQLAVRVVDVDRQPE